MNTSRYKVYRENVENIHITIYIGQKTVSSAHMKVTSRQKTIEL